MSRRDQPAGSPFQMAGAEYQAALSVFASVSGTFGLGLLGLNFLLNESGGSG
jgi:hypothetical protein